jgi:FkbM family methyltransferase
MDGDVSLGARMQSLLDRRLPLRTRLDLLLADLRRKWARRELYGVRYGPGRVYLSDADYAVDRASFTFAVIEANYATDYEGSAVLDAGGHKGYYAAYVSAHGARAVVSYEPETANLEILERTASGYGNAWDVRRAAVDARAGRADLHVMGGSWGHALDPPSAFAEHEVGVEPVDVVSLAEALRQAGAHVVAGGRLVVKMNIEGAECSAILGTPAGAWADVDEVFVETHPWADCDGVRLAEHLARAGLRRVESAHQAVLRMRRG